MVIVQNENFLEFLVVLGDNCPDRTANATVANVLLVKVVIQDISPRIQMYLFSRLSICFVATDLTLEETVPTVPPLQLPVLPSPDVLGSPLATPTSPALSDDSDCLFRLDVDNVRSLLPQDTTALPPLLRITNEGTCSNEILISVQTNPAIIIIVI